MYSKAVSLHISCSARSKLWHRVDVDDKSHLGLLSSIFRNGVRLLRENLFFGAQKEGQCLVFSLFDLSQSRLPYA